jgi:hypothetical protein
MMVRPACPILTVAGDPKYSRSADVPGALAGQAGLQSGGDWVRKVSRVGARLDAGAIVDEVVAEDGSVVQVRYERCPAGWQASFELRHPDVGDLAVVHRLVNDTLAEAKATVPAAIAFLKGRPVDDDL